MILSSYLSSLPPNGALNSQASTPKGDKADDLILDSTSFQGIQRVNKHPEQKTSSGFHSSRPATLPAFLSIAHRTSMNTNTMGSYQPVQHDPDMEQPRMSDSSTAWKNEFIEEKQDLARRTLAYCKTHINQIMTGALIIVTLMQFLSIQRMTQATRTITSVAAQNYTIHKSYGGDTRYMSLDSQFDTLWNHELVPDNGVINLPPYDSSGKTTVNEYGVIGMLHALHCLGGIRRAMQTARNDALSRNGHDIGLDYKSDPHWPHCFHYLRELILCHADDTIERAHFLNGTVSLAGQAPAFFEGQLDVRQCRDSEKLFQTRKLHSDSNKDGVPNVW